MMHWLLRLYDYSSGSIKFDGRELVDLDRQWVCSQFSVVMQEPFLFSKTIGDNIRLGRGAAENEEIREAARLAELAEQDGLYRRLWTIPNALENEMLAETAP
jgi:ATP-binding cassette subfamily B protein